MKNNVDLILNYFNQLYPNPKTELIYTHDYELLIAVVLSAQTTDKKVNKVTSVLFKDYPTLEALVNIPGTELLKLLKPLGMAKKKSVYIKQIVNKLYYQYHGKVPNERQDLESFSGVGRKTTNVVLAILFNEPCMPVDTHVKRVSQRLGLVNSNKEEIIEKQLSEIIPSSLLLKAHHQLILFGRYQCKAKQPLCTSCQLKNICHYYNKKEYE